MKHTHVHQKGFTLIEVLVALALMALLSLISWRALDMVERSNGRLNASADDTLGLVRVLGQIESDISRHASNDILTSAMQWDPSAPTSAILPPGIVWHEPVLTVLRSAHNGAWQKVIWGMEGNTLRRAVGPATHTLPLPDPGVSEIVLEQVGRFMVRGWVPGQGWSSLSTQNAQSAATGLEVVIARRHNGVDEIYRKVVRLP